MLYGLNNNTKNSIIKNILKVLKFNLNNLLSVKNINKVVALITDGVKLVRNI